MSVAKITEITSTSKKSFADAVESGIKRASKTIRGISGAWVADQEVIGQGRQGHRVQGPPEADLRARRQEIAGKQSGLPRRRQPAQSTGVSVDDYCTLVVFAGRCWPRLRPLRTWPGQHRASLLLLRPPPALAADDSRRRCWSSRRKATRLFVLDVRTPEEFAAGHVPGAVNVPHDQLASRLAEVPKDKDVVLYCQSGTSRRTRCRRAARRMATRGCRTSKATCRRGCRTAARSRAATQPGPRRARDERGQRLTRPQPPSAWSRSAIRSSTCSRPIDIRSRPCGVRLCGPSIDARCSIRLSTPPRLVARVKSLRAPRRPRIASARRPALRPTARRRSHRSSAAARSHGPGGRGSPA